MNKKLYVGNLATEVTETDLSFPSVNHRRIGRFP